MNSPAASFEASDVQSQEDASNAALDWRPLFLACSVFAGYYLGAKLGFALTFHPHPVSVLWPPNSILLAALLLTPRRAWWIPLLAALPAHLLVQLQSNVPPEMIFCWFVSNCCEALIGAGCIRYFIPRPVRLDRLGNVAIFCLFGATLGPFLSSFLDAGFVVLNHWGTGSYWEIWRIRFSSNTLAALTITPCIVTAATDGIAFWKNISRRQWLEGGCLLLGLVVISFVLFNEITSEADSALLYMPLPFLLWAAVRFGSRGATAAILIVTLMAIWGLAHGNGPFSENSAETNALYAQLFLIFMAVPLLFLAALIEERNKVEGTLRERDERIGLAAETANFALWTIDFERGEGWVSDKGRDLFGFGPNEPLSRAAFLGRVHPDDRDAVNDAIEQARTGSLAFEIGYRLLRQDGDVCWLISRGRYLRNDHGEISELIGVAIDITGQVKANLELRLQREEMARLSRVAVMGEMSAALAHEINQPLAGIVSNASAGQRFIDRGNVDLQELRELLADISADGRRAGNVVSGIRNMVKKGEAARQRLDLNQVVKNVVQMVNPDALLHSCELQTSLAADLPAVEADLIQVQQVLLNLILNAFDAMRETPIAQRKVEITTSRNGEDTVITSVRDHGIGFPEEANDRLFEQFFTTKPEGLGMGLAIVRSILESHAGTIAAENAEGGGARFHFTLPIQPTV